jgi:hypothetical protein
MAEIYEDKDFISAMNNLLYKEQKDSISTIIKNNYKLESYYYSIKKDYQSGLKLKNIDQSHQEGVYSSMKKLYDEYISPGVTTILKWNQAISQVLFPVALVAEDALIKCHQWSKTAQVQIKPNSKLDKFLSKYGEASTSEVFYHSLNFMVGK